jgi:hypothetical protein
MRVETLADQAGARWRAAEEERLRPVVRQDAWVASLRADWRRAHAERRWLTMLRLWRTVQREQREAGRLSLYCAVPSPDELMSRAEQQAQTHAAEALERALPDDAWRLFRGYQGGSGELDCLLVGPCGIFGVEVEVASRGERVDVWGDQWWLQELDDYGRPMGVRAPMLDEHGRSPSQQAAQACRVLGDWLRSNGQAVTPVPLVLVDDPDARLSVKFPTVEIVTSVEDLTGVVRLSGAALDGNQLTDIADLIRRGHRHLGRRLVAHGAHQPTAFPAKINFK